MLVYWGKQESAYISYLQPLVEGVVAILSALSAKLRKIKCYVHNSQLAQP